MKARSVVDSDGARKADLAAIHIAKKDLGWDDDFYRDIIFSVCRARSAAALDFTGRKRLLAHMKACGWAGSGVRRPGPANRAAATVTPRAPLSPLQRKIWSLWQQLADAGLVGERKTPALNAWLARHTGVERLEWLQGKQADLAIEGLKAWLSRKVAA